MENVKRESAVEIVEDNQVSRMSFSDEETDGDYSSGKDFLYVVTCSLYVHVYTLRVRQCKFRVHVCTLCVHVCT